MFRSRFIEVLCVLLFNHILAYTAISESYQDTLFKVDPKPEADSTLLFLNSPDFNSKLDRAIHYQGLADSLHRLSIEWRKEAAKMDDPVLRGRLQHKIMDIEDSVLVLRSLANEEFRMLSESIPQISMESQVHPFLLKDTVLNGITVYNYNLTDEFKLRLEEIRTPARIDTEPSGKGLQEKIEDRPVEFVGLKVSDSSPYGEGKPFERNFSVPPGVFYRIQLAVYQRELQSDHFGGLSPITTEYIPERDLTRYFVGKFTRMDDAKIALTKVRALGFPDAFVIGYYNGVKSSFSKLRALEE